MKISEYIEKLKRIQDLAGDLDCLFSTYQGDDGNVIINDDFPIIQNNFLIIEDPSKTLNIEITKSLKDNKKIVVLFGTGTDPEFDTTEIPAYLNGIYLAEEKENLYRNDFDEISPENLTKITYGDIEKGLINFKDLLQDESK